MNSDESMGRGLRSSNHLDLVFSANLVVQSSQIPPPGCQ